MDILKVDGFNNIYQVDCFQTEFLKTVKERPKKQGIKSRYQDWLVRSLAILDELGFNALSLPAFEKLNDTDRIYSIRYTKSIKNPRVLFVFFDGRNIILLTSFLEKSKADYDKALEVAKNRLRLIKER